MMLTQILFVFELLLTFQICNSVSRDQHDDLCCNDSTSINVPQENIFEFDRLEVHRQNFPEGFVFGTGSSAYQVEGGTKEGGRGPCIWDEFSRVPGNIINNATGDVTSDQYHRFEEDILIMKNLNMDAYRFSISWSRLIPDGEGLVNWVGVEYYNSLIDSLLLQNIEPYVTIYHWDLPQALEESMGGWLHSNIIPFYAKFAKLCFQLFGDRVKNWITFNEIHVFTMHGYQDGKFAPGRCSPPFGNCAKGNSLIEPYIVAHNALNAHASVVNIYRTQFQGDQKGRTGLTVDSMWFEPMTNHSRDKKAGNFAMESVLGWILDPIFFGHYPISLQQSIGDHLPRFTTKEVSLVKGSYDFIGLNHYSSQYATFNSTDDSDDPSQIFQTPYKDGILIGPQAASTWIFISPIGMRKVLGWIRERYNNPLVIITENGVDGFNSDGLLSLNKQLEDYYRIDYHHDYLKNLLLAIRDGSDVRGYFVWSMMDNFEWENGFHLRFGIYYIDFNNNQKRYPKASAHWFQNILKRTHQK